MVKKSKKKAPSKAKTVKPVEMPPPPPPPPPRVSFRPRPTKSTTTRKSSVIMLSSPESSFGEEPSLILNEPSISIIDLARPSTRMSLAEMDMTDLSDPRFSTRSCAGSGDDTDLSLTNIVQTPGVHRERPKSSWVMRRTRSKSMAPPPPPPPLAQQDDLLEGGRPRRSRRTQSGDFVTVTRRARSVRPPARFLESIDENGGQRRLPETPRVEGTNVEPRTPAVTPGISRVTKRKRNVAREKVAEEVVPGAEQVSTRRRSNRMVPEESQSSQATSEEDSNKSLEATTVSMVSVRRRRPVERAPSPEYPPEEPVVELTPAVLPRTSESLSRTRSRAVERPASPEYTEKPVAEPTPAPEVRSRARSRSRGRQLPSESVTRTRSRAVERSALPRKSVVELASTPAIRTRARSASRSRQLPQESVTITRSRRVERPASPKFAEEPVVEPTPTPAIRSRARSRSRARQLPPENVTIPRNRRVQRPASPELPNEPVVEPNPAPEVRPRARSRTRGRQLPSENVTISRSRRVQRPASPEKPVDEPTENLSRTRSRAFERPASPEYTEDPVAEPTPAPEVRPRARSASRSLQVPPKSVTRTRSQSVERPASQEYTEEPVVEPTPTPAIRPRARSRTRGRQLPSENVTISRSRRVQRPASPEKPVDKPPAIRQRARSASGGRQQSPENPPVDPTIRPRTQSASRGLQPPPESAPRPKRATKKVSKCPCCVNGDSHHEPQPARGRSRTRSELPPKTTKSARSRSAAQEPAPITSPPRSKSVSREPHVPVYRLPVEVPAAKPAKVVATASAAAEDVYAFDSPGLLGQEAVAEGEKKRKRKPADSVKKKAKLEGSTTRGKRTTLAKKNPLVASIFGTDMSQIRRVVKKIGGGPVKRPPTPLETVSLARPASPVASNYDPVEETDHFAEDDHPVENVEPEIVQPVIIPASPPPPSVEKVNPLIERILQQRPETPDRTAPPNVTLTFSPLGASSPWRVQNESVLPRTFYFSRSKDLLPSYESDVVVRDENVRPKTPAAEPVPEPAPVSPAKQPSPPAAITGAKAEAMFKGIQKSYEQLKVTSEMSNKLITAMRKYKTNVHNQSLASMSASGELPEDERLIAKFREYEANMKKTYQKLKQWYERSQQQLTLSIKTIEQVSTVPKTLAQRQVLDNFRRDSKVFLTMINELESAMNDSNVENVSPPVPPSDKPTFKDVVILTERNLANRNRSPLKTLEIANVPARFSPIKSPLVRSSFTAPFPTKPKPAQPAPPTTTEDHPKKDLFGFEEDDDSDEPIAPPPTTTRVAATPIQITKKTLKEKLASVRKMLPPVRPPSRTYSRREIRVPQVIGSPSRKQPRSVQSVFASSTPLAQKRNQSTTTRRGQLTDVQDVDLSAIADETELEQSVAGPPVDLFDEVVASTSLSTVNRTYSRVPRRNHKRKRNVYLADLGLSDDEDEEEESDHESAQEQEDVADGEYTDKTKKQANKKRRVAASKKKNAVEETNEFKQFVSEFNSMCEEVDRYKLVIEKPTATAAGGVRQCVL